MRKGLHELLPKNNRYPQEELLSMTVLQRRVWGTKRKRILRLVQCRVKAQGQIKDEKQAQYLEGYESLLRARKYSTQQMRAQRHLLRPWESLESHVQHGRYTFFQTLGLGLICCRCPQVWTHTFLYPVTAQVTSLDVIRAPPQMLRWATICLPTCTHCSRHHSKLTTSNKTPPTYLLHKPVPGLSRLSVLKSTFSSTPMGTNTFIKHTQ